MKHLLKFPILIILLFSSSASSAQSSGNLQLDTLLSNTLDSMRTEIGRAHV